MHAEACVYDFVYLDMSVFTRLQIQHSIFIILLLPFAFCLSPFTFHLSTQSLNPSLPHSLTFAFCLPDETGVYRMHAEACVYDFVYLDMSVFTRLQIQHSIFIILLLPFAFCLSPFTFHLSTQSLNPSIPNFLTLHSPLPNLSSLFAI